MNPAPNDAHMVLCAWCHAPLDPQQPWAYLSPPRCRSCLLGHEQKRLRRQLARAQKAGLAATLTLDQWVKTLDHFEWRCATCKNTFEVLEHLVPLDAQGGTTDLNCVPACKTCNAIKQHQSPQRAALSLVLAQLHSDHISIPPNHTSTNAVAFRYVMAYMRALRQGVGLSQDALAQRLKVSLRTLSRYESDPPDAMPNAALLIRLMTVLPVQAADMARLLEPDATNDMALMLAEQALVSAAQTLPVGSLLSTHQITVDLLRLMAALRANDALRQAMEALVRGWDNPNSRRVAQN